MSKTRYKVTYNCDCSCGDCNKKNSFLLEQDHSTDYTQIIHIYHLDENHVIENLGDFTDNGISTLIKILTESEPSEIWNEDDFKFKNEIKWT